MTKSSGRSYNNLGKKGTFNKGMFDFTREIDSFRSSAGNTMQSGSGVSDIRFVMTYGFGFITLMFLGFLSGFCLGYYALEWDF